MSQARLSTVPPRLVPSGALRVVLSGVNRLVLSGAAASCYQAHATPIEPYPAGFSDDSNLSNRVFQTFSNAALRGAAVDNFLAVSAARSPSWGLSPRLEDNPFSEGARP